MKNKPTLLSIVSLIIALVFLLTACGGRTSTQPAGSVNFQVHITDNSNSPLSGVKVVSQSQPEGQLKISGLTGDDGNVAFDSVKTGDYTLYVNRFDYNQVQVAITLTPANNNLTVKMSKSVTTTPIPTNSVVVTFDQLISQPQNYSGGFVTLGAFYFSGFEISALTSELVPATYNPNNFTPKQPLIWVTGNQGQAVYDSLYSQSETPSGYPERYGKVQITGQFQYGGKYGHLDSYSYQLTVTGSEIIPWTPPAK